MARSASIQLCTWALLIFTALPRWLKAYSYPLQELPPAAIRNRLAACAGPHFAVIPVEVGSVRHIVFSIQIHCAIPLTGDIRHLNW